MKDGKMSKSKGNVIYPETLVDRYGLDALRYYLMRAMPYGNDGVFSPEDFVDRLNYDLANDLGNLLNRTVAMINKYEGGQLPQYQAGVTEFDADLEATAAAVITNYHDLMNQMHFADALAEIWKLVARSNKYIDETEPWKLAKDDSKATELAAVMAHLAASLRVIATLISPVMTHAPKEIFDQLGLDVATLTMTDLALADLPAGKQVVAKGTPIFPRIDVQEEVDFIQGKMTKSEKTKGRAAMAAKAEAQQVANEPAAEDLTLNKPEIRFDKFEKIELRVAEIKAVDHVDGADKLLKFQLDAGDQGTRQILSGIAEWYPEPQELVGKKVVIVANLKPRKMRGQVSQGMLLSAEHDGQVTLLTLPDSLVNGSDVS